MTTFSSSSDVARLITDQNALMQTSQFHVNITQEYILTTEDKLKLCLKERLQRLEKRKDWIAPMALIITVLLTLVTCDFKERWLSAATWQAIFIVSLVVIAVWFISCLRFATKAPTLESVVREIKEGAIKPQPETASGSGKA